MNFILNIYSLLFQIYRGKKLLKGMMKIGQLLLLVILSFQSFGQYVPDAGGSFTGPVDFQQGLRVIKTTGSSILDPATITLRANGGASDWDTNLSWGNLDFHANDGSGIGNAVRARFGAFMTHAGGGRTGLKFFTSDHTGLYERMVIDELGEVGIGLSNPSGLLHLWSDQNSNSRLIVDMASASNNTGIELKSYNIGSGSYWIKAEGNNGSDAFAIRGSGEVGIGTTNPDVRLQVNGGTGISDLTSGKGVVQIGAYDATHMSLDGNEIQVSSNGSAEHLMLQKHGGKVGIGTNVPLGQLHIRTNSTGGTVNANYDNLVIEQNSDNSGMTFLSKNSQNAGISFADGQSDIQGLIGYIHNSDNMIFYTDGQERLRINENGALGIGTNSPNAPLHIAQNSASGLLFSRSSHDSYGVYLANSDGLRIRNNTDSRDEMVFLGNGNIGIGNSQPTEKLDVSGNIRFTGELITENGEIGIGTTNPGVYSAHGGSTNFGSALDVRGEVLTEGGIRILSKVNYAHAYTQNVFTTSVNQNAKGNNRPAGWVAQVHSAGGTGYAPTLLNFRAGYSSEAGSANNNTLLDVLDTNPILSLWAQYQSHRRVGILNSQPTATLDVARGNAESGTAIFRGTNRHSHFNYHNDENTYIRGGKTNSNVFINDNGGNVGIGTTNPTQKLTVAGKINAREIILENVTGADFVFEEDYELRSLEETEQFIKANKHLPEIPSAAEMAEEGLALKEMNMLLLQKVEELTLHLIRQEKEMDTMRQDNSVLTNTVRDLQDKVLKLSKD